jgi:hypothetical protein
MQALFNLFRGRRTSSQRPRRTQLAFEAMEDRLVPSASSLAIHAVTDTQGSAVFYQKSDGLHEKDAGGVNHVLYGNPNWTVALSAGVDSSGHADVFVTGTDKTMWEFNSSGWRNLNAPEFMKEFAAVKGDRVYAVGADNAMWEWSPPIWFGRFHFGGWSQLSGPGTVQFLDAVTQTSGTDAVFAIRQDGSLQKFSQGSWQWLAVPNYFTVGYWSLSAGLDQNGNADVFGLSRSNDQLWRWTSSTGWSALGSAGQAWWISATTSGQVDFIGMDSHLYKFDGSGFLHTLSTSDNYSEISGAADNDVYAVDWSRFLVERGGGGVWHTWDSNVW